LRADDHHVEQPEQQDQRAELQQQRLDVGAAGSWRGAGRLGESRAGGQKQPCRGQKGAHSLSKDDLWATQAPRKAPGSYALGLGFAMRGPAARKRVWTKP